MDVKDKYKDRIVFSEGAFPRYGECGWLYESEDDTGVFRLREGTFRQHFDDWAPPDWIFSEPVQDEGLASNSKHGKDEETQSRVNIESDPDNEAQEDGKMQCDSTSQEKEDEEIQTADTVMVSLSATEKEITRTLLSMNGGNDATEQGTPVKNIIHSVPTACTSSTTMSHGTVVTTTKFEGFDIKSDLVPTMQKIWQKHGNIAKSSTIRNREIVARALETLATMVQILEDNSALSLIDSQADYLVSTLSDLRSMCFQVAWLIPSVEKAVQLHKDKPLLDSLINLNQVHSKVSKRRAILLDECAKLGTEENKLKGEIAKLSARISLHGKVRFNEPLGSGLT